MSKLGIQWQIETDAVLEYNRLIKPVVLKGINCHTREFWQLLANDNPNSIRIYRHYPNWDDWQADPERCAADAVAQLKSEIGHILDLITHVEDNNEWIHSYMLDQVDAADRYMAEFIKLAWGELGLRTVFLNSACGHWGDDIVAFWRTLEAAETYQAALGQHEYDWPLMDRIFQESGDYWLCGKWQRSMAAIKTAGYDGIKCIITECGVDGGVADQPMRGWKSATPLPLQDYTGPHGLGWYNDLLNSDDDVLGVAIFIISGEGMWNDFDIKDTGVPDRIAQFPTVPIPDPELPPNGGDTMSLDNIRVFKLNEDADGYTEGHTELLALADKEALIYGKYGAAFRRAKVAPGQKVYRLTELWEKTGNTSLITQILGLSGEPLANIDVAFYWPDAPDPPDPPTEVTPHDWYGNFVHGPTNENGEIGPGMGTGAYFAEGEGGPHAVWVRNSSILTDICEKLGMIAGTFHDHLDQKFALVEEGGEEPDPDPEPGEALEIIADIRIKLNQLETILSGLDVTTEALAQELRDMF